MDKGKSKDNLRAAGKKRLEEFRQKRLQQKTSAKQEDADPAEVGPADLPDLSDNGVNVSVDDSSEAASSHDDNAEVLQYQKTQTLEGEAPSQSESALAEQLRSCEVEINSYKQAVQNVSLELAKVKQEKEREIGNIRAEKIDLEKEVNHCRQHAESIQSENVKLQDELQGVKLQATKYAEENTELQFSLVSCQGQLKESKSRELAAISEFEASERKIFDSERSLAVQQEALESKINQLKVEKLDMARKVDEDQGKVNSQIEDLKKQLEDLSQEKAVLAADLGKLNENCKELANQFEASNTNAERLKLRESELLQELNLVQEQKTAALAEASDRNNELMKEVEKLESLHSETSQQLSQLDQKFQEAQKQFEDTRRESIIIGTDFATLKEEYDRAINSQMRLQQEAEGSKQHFTVELRALQQKLQDFESERELLVAENTNLANSQIQVEAALLRATDENSQHLAHIEELKVRLEDIEKKAAVAAAKAEKEMADQITEFGYVLAALQEALEKRSAAAHDLDSCVVHSRLADEFLALKGILLTSVEEEMKHEGKNTVLTDKLQSELANKKDEVQRLESEISLLSSHAEHLKNQLGEAAAENEKLSGEVSMLQKNAEEVSLEKELLNEKLTCSSQILEDANELNKLLSVQMETLQLDAQHAVAEKLEAESQFKALKCEELQSAEELSALRNRVEVLQKELQEKIEIESEELIMLRSSKVSMEQEFSCLEKERAALDSQVSVLSQKLQELEQVNRQLASTVEELQLERSQTEKTSKSTGTRSDVVLKDEETMTEEENRIERFENEISRLCQERNQIGSFVELVLQSFESTASASAQEESGECLPVLTALKEKAHDVVLELQKGKTALASALVDIEKLRSANVKLQHEVEQAESRYSSTKEKLGLAVTKGKSLVQTRDTLKQELEAQSAKIEAMQHAHKGEIESRDSALKMLEYKLKATEESFEALNMELTSKQQVTQNLGRLLEERNDVIRIASDMLSHCGISDEELDLTGKVEWLTEAYKMEQKKVVADREQMAVFAKTVDSLTTELTTLQRSSKSSEDQIITKQKEVDLLKNQLAQLAGEHSQALLLERESLQSRIEEFILSENQLKQNLDTAVKQLQDSNRRIEECEVSLNLQKEGYQSQLDALGLERGKLQTELVESEKKLVAIREKLSLAIKKGKGLVQQRDALKQSLELADAASEHELQLLRGELENMSARCEALELEVTGARNALSEAQVNLKAADDNFRTVKLTLNKISSLIGLGELDSMEKIEHLVVAFTNFKARFITLEKELTKAIEFSKELQKHEESLMTELESARDDCDKLGDRLQDLLNEKDVLNDELDSTRKELSTCRKMLSEVTVRESSLASNVVVLKRKLSEISEEKQLLESSRREAWTRLEKANKEVETLTSLLQAGTDSEHQLTLLNDALASKSEELKKTNSLLENNRNLHEGVLLSIKRQLGDVNHVLRETSQQSMAALVDIERLAHQFLSAFGAEKQHSSWKREKTIGASSNVSDDIEKEMQVIKGRLEQEAAVFSEMASRTKELLSESFHELDSLKKLFAVPASNLHQHIATILQELKSKEEELVNMHSALSSKDEELGSYINQLEDANAHIDSLSVNVEELEDLLNKKEAARAKAVSKLTFTLNKLSELHQQCEAMLAEIEKLQTSLESRDQEISNLSSKIAASDEQLKVLQNNLSEKKSEVLKMENKLRFLVMKMRSRKGEMDGDMGGHVEALELLDAEIQQLLGEKEVLKLAVQRKDEILRHMKEEFDLKEQSFEEKQPRRVTEIEEVDHLPKYVTQVRSMKKLPATDHLAIDMDADENRLLSDLQTKGHVFKSLGAAPIFPRATRYLSDKIDGLCVSAGKSLMKQPVARLTVFVYWIAIHIWIVTMLTVAKI